MCRASPCRRPSPFGRIRDGPLSSASLDSRLRHLFSSGSGLLWRTPAFPSSPITRRELCHLIKRGSWWIRPCRLPRPWPHGLREALSELDAEGCRAIGATVLVGSYHVTPDLPRVRASHTWTHEAEGWLYREALLRACDACGLPTAGVRELDVIERLAEAVGDAPGQLRHRLTALGRELGPPWVFEVVAGPESSTAGSLVVTHAPDAQPQRSPRTWDTMCRPHVRNSASTIFRLHLV